MADERRRSRSRSRDREDSDQAQPIFTGGMTAQQIANLPMFANAGGVSEEQAKLSMILRGTSFVCFFVCLFVLLMFLSVKEVWMCI